MTEAERALREREHVAAQRHAGELLALVRVWLAVPWWEDAPEDLRRLIAEIEKEART